MKKKFIVSLVCIAAVGMIGFRLVNNKRKINEKKRPAQVESVRIPVTVAAAKEAIQKTGLVKTGTLAPVKEAKVLSVNSGNIRRLLFELGDHIRQGQLLAVIDTRLLELDLQKAESNMSKLGRDLQTYTELLAGNAVTREKVDEIRQRYTDAENQVLQLRRQIADASIKAPIGGIISARNVEEGMFVTAGAGIGAVVDISRLKVRVNLTESEVYRVEMGQEVELTTDIFPGRTFKGRVSYISPQANEAYNYQVEIAVSNEGKPALRSGTFVYADFSGTAPKKTLLIPREALVGSAREASVYLVRDSSVILRSVKAGDEYGSYIGITGGLQAGDRVVTSGQINLRDGSLINVSK